MFSFFVRCFPKVVLSRKCMESPKRILLVIAHPDDECLFFGPTILALLRQSQRHFYVLCLSNGDYEGKGHVRKQELYDSCTSLGILSGNILLVKHDHLRDDPKANWSTELVGKLVAAFVQSHDIDTLITFDGYGVSGHKNHSAIYVAIEELLLHSKFPQFCTPYALESVNIIRKYMPSLFELPFSLLLSSFMYVAEREDYSKLLYAMNQHYSQVVWFRRLYLIFSRYLSVNTLRPISGSRQSKIVK
ncbi:unnamed protein product [Allacma fusca]|uniref:N-acetylglucosaminylphosphatidylinositol deacetylase n=1 Tax=Allacma fusca TaxID=39272 RepID=A0A8J2LSH4_9HEXA|nr:unnamed protein product [Allacma fusca]